jgi:hypothetical protein
MMLIDYRDYFQYIKLKHPKRLKTIQKLIEWSQYEAEILPLIIG